MLLPRGLLAPKNVFDIIIGTGIYNYEDLYLPSGTFCAQKYVSPLISVIFNTFNETSFRCKLTLVFVIYLLILKSINLYSKLKNGTLEEIPFSIRLKGPDDSATGLRGSGRNIFLSLLLKNVPMK